MWKVKIHFPGFSKEKEHRSVQTLKEGRKEVRGSLHRKLGLLLAGIRSSFVESMQPAVGAGF